MKIIKKSLNEQIYYILKEEILNNKIKCGTTLVNRELQERFNVSSTPVRDALLRLKEDGIIESINHSGAKLIDFNYEFAIKINQLILILTLGAFELLKNDIDSNLLIELRNNLYLEEKNIETDLYYEYDYNFHKTIFEFCKNSLLKDMFTKYNLILQLLARYYHDNSSNKYEIRKKCIKEHIEILNALEKRNIDLVLELIHSHYMKAEIFFKKFNFQPIK